MASAAPRWKNAITNALAENEKSVVIQLASIDPTTPIPHVRSHIFRSFLSPKSNPSHPLLLTSTDIRTPKTSQIISNPHVQLAWWIEGTQEQFRISGLASIIPTPDNILYKYFMHSTRSPGGTGRDAAPGTGGPAFAALNSEGFDWEEKRREVFGSMSGHMKASWCRPVPGSKLEGGYEEAKNWPVKLDDTDLYGDEEKKRNWEMALGNFALVVVDPTEVDYVELGVVPNRRTRFWRTRDGVWKEEAVVP